MNKYNPSNGRIDFQKARFFRRRDNNDFAYCIEPFEYFDESYQHESVDIPNSPSVEKLDRIKKISYSTSFGVPYKGTLKETKKLKKNLERFNSLSVRDRLSINITKYILGINSVTQVCDPIFICEFSEYLKLANKSDASEKLEYILAYVLDPTSEKGQRLEQLSIDKNISVIIILEEDQSLWQLNKKRLNLRGFGNVKVKEKVNLYDFMWLYYHSKAVFTDSFHGTVFSIIFKKPFVSLINIERGGERFLSLLEPINLRDRLFENVSCINDKYELYEELEKGIKSLENGEVYSAEEVFDEIEKI